MSKYLTVVHRFETEEELEHFFQDKVAPNIIPKGGSVSRYMTGDVITNFFNFEDKIINCVTMQGVQNVINGDNKDD